jgi:hypothetical protein
MAGLLFLENLKIFSPAESRKGKTWKIIRAPNTDN